MHLTITADQVALHAAQDLTSLAVATSLPPHALVEALPEGIVLDEDQAHVWIEPQRLRELAGQWASEQEWSVRFEGMVAYATAKGWTDARGRIRAHLEAGTDGQE